MTKFLRSCNILRKDSMRQRTFSLHKSIKVDDYRNLTYMASWLEGVPLQRYLDFILPVCTHFDFHNDDNAACTLLL